MWRRQQGIGSDWEIAGGSGRNPEYNAARFAQLVKTTIQTKPTRATHWRTRMMAREHSPPLQDAVVLSVDE